LYISYVSPVTTPLGIPTFKLAAFFLQSQDIWVDDKRAGVPLTNRRNIMDIGRSAYLGMG
jgi:hypothetical protein